MIDCHGREDIRLPRFSSRTRREHGTRPERASSAFLPSNFRSIPRILFYVDRTLRSPLSSSLETFSCIFRFVWCCFFRLDRNGLAASQSSIMYVVAAQPNSFRQPTDLSSVSVAKTKIIVHPPLLSLFAGFCLSIRRSRQIFKLRLLVISDSA